MTFPYDPHYEAAGDDPYGWKPRALKAEAEAAVLRADRDAARKAASAFACQVNDLKQQLAAVTARTFVWMPPRATNLRDWCEQALRLFRRPDTRAECYAELSTEMSTKLFVSLRELLEEEEAP